MNETYEWLYDHYAQPLIQVEKEADELKQAIITYSGPDRQILPAGPAGQPLYAVGNRCLRPGPAAGPAPDGRPAGRRAGGPEVS